LAGRRRVGADAVGGSVAGRVSDVVSGTASTAGSATGVAVLMVRVLGAVMTWASVVNAHHL
jgi:hypothetical protein